MSTKNESWRKKKIIQVTVEEFSGYDFDVKASDVIEKMNLLIQQYGPDVRLDYDRDYHYPYDSSPTPMYFVKIQRLETDDEWKKRITEYEFLLKQTEQQEREQLAKLKSKFGEK